MGNNYFKYKGYLGSVETSLEDDCLYGEVLYLNDVITYQARSPKDLETQFIEAVDDYLSTCKELNREPNKPFGGTFNVRVGPDLHKDASIQAKLNGMNLNDFVKQAIEEKLSVDNKELKIVHHHYNHEARVISETTASIEGEFQSQEDPWKKRTVIQRHH